MGLSGSTGNNRYLGISGNSFIPQNSFYNSLYLKGSGLKQFYLGNLNQKIKSIKATDSCIMTLDETGSISITYCPYSFGHLNKLNVYDNIENILQDQEMWM